MHLKKLIIEGFQSHDKNEFDFVEGLNIIVGESDSGKTALMRALRFLIYNKPAFNEDFIHKGKNSIKITSYWSSDVVIIRERSKTVNRYAINKDGKETILESFGKEVPKEVEEALQFGKVLIGDKYYELNYNGQFSPPFLLGQEDSVKAKFLGQLNEVNYIDTAIDGINNDIRELNSKQKTLKENIPHLKDELKKFINLEKFNKQLEEIFQTFKKIDNLLKEQTLLENFIEEFSKIDQREKNIENKLNLLKKVNYKEIEKLIEKTKEVEQIEELTNEGFYLKEKYTKIINKLGLLNDINYKEAEILINLYENALSVKELIDKGQKIRGKYIEIQEKINSNSIKLKQSEEELINILKELKLCPMCFTELTENRIIEILQRI